MMLTPAQCRAARALIEWNQIRLADASGVSVNTIRDFEGGKRTPITNNLTAIKNALEDAGVKFVRADNWEGVMAKGR